MGISDQRRNTYEIIISKDAESQLKKLPIKISPKIRLAIAQLAYRPYLGKTLKGEHKGQYTLRVWPYRIIYRIFKQRLIIEILDVDHRQGAYK